MHHLIVVAHPAENSFTIALARAFAGELLTRGHSVKFLDLYRARFNPVLSARELSEGPDPDAVAAQEDIRRADVLTLVYPLWWLSMPAMLKGYIDRVFSYGFAYESGEEGVHGLLKDKQAVLITLSAAPLARFYASGAWNAVQLLQEAHMLRNPGFQLLEHLHFDEIEPGLPAEIAEQHFARVRNCVGRLWPAPIGKE
jgi:NAD(P)H dehydrogenase (quinone)